MCLPYGHARHYLLDQGQRAGADHKPARVPTAWTITTRTATAAAIALWGVLAGLTGTRTAIAGILLLATIALLLWRGRASSTPRRRLPAPGESGAGSRTT